MTSLGTSQLSVRYARENNSGANPKRTVLGEGVRERETRILLHSCLDFR